MTFKIKKLSQTQNFLPVCEPALLGNERQYLLEALEGGWISSSGAFIPRFEKSFAAYCGVDFGVSVCNGTAALHLALRSLGIESGHEVILPSFTMIATAFAVCYTGAKPVFVDVDAQSWNLDPMQIKAKITSHTKAIVPVHIMGLPCDMDSIASIAKEHELFIVEDAAEAHGAEYKKRKTGSLSDIACFSFYANKNLTTGEGGMCLTSDPALYERLRYYRNLCFPLSSAREYDHKEIGFNYRMSNLQAAIGLAQVEKADEYRSMRRRNAELYRNYLADLSGLQFQSDDDPEKLHAHWMNAIVLEPKIFKKTRDELMQILKENRIDSRKLFMGMHRQRSLKDFACEPSASYPKTDSLSDHGLYLPSASSLKKEEISRVCETIKKAGVN